MKIKDKYGIIKGDELIVYSYLHLGNNNGLSAVVSQQAKRILKEDENMKSVYSKRWDDKHGFTQKEAEEKKRKVDAENGANYPDSKWNPAVIEPDPERLDGFRVVAVSKGHKD